MNTAMSFLRNGESSKNLNDSFYPTPEKLADQLLYMVKWDKVVDVLEPSAGKGDLALAVAKKTYYKRRGCFPRDHSDLMDFVHLDCIEIDPYLRAYLDEQDFRVIHDDFLTFSTFKRYDLIVMNPPFNEGDRHLMKALELMENGGQIACILNAETIRNPYSMLRKELAARLSQYKAVIEFVENGFRDAERKTDVEVALIHVAIPPKELDSDIMEGMRKAPTYKAQEIPEQYHDIVVYNQIDEIVNKYNFEIACGIKLIEEWVAMSNMLKSGSDKYDSPILDLTLHAERYSSSLDETVNSYVRETRSKYWRAVFLKDIFQKALTSNLIEDLHNNVKKLADYDFSYFNIMTLVVKMTGKISQGVEATIMKLFDEWTYQYHWDEHSANRHYFNGWKTNDAFAVGKKVIIPFYGFETHWDNTKTLDEHRVASKLRDIEKVFNYLDGGRTPEYVPTIETIVSWMKSMGRISNVETKYFKVTLYKKGTMHLVFRDEKLLEKFNLFAAQHKNWLPPSYGKKKYADMTDEEKAVIDSFQGEEAYANVMVNADYYLGLGGQPQFAGMLTGGIT
jgi:hypothetical protein